MLMWKIDADGKRTLVTPASLRARTRKLRQKGNRQVARNDVRTRGEQR